MHLVNFGKVTNSSIYFSEVMKAGGLDVGDPVEQQVLLRVAVWKTCEHSDTVQTAFLIDQWLMLGLSFGQNLWPYLFGKVR